MIGACKLDLRGISKKLRIGDVVDAYIRFIRLQSRLKGSNEIPTKHPIVDNGQGRRPH